MSITWGANEVANEFIAKGVEPTLAGKIDTFIGLFTGTWFPTVGRDASLILALNSIIRPVVAVARACWGIKGVAGTTPATVQSIIDWINTVPAWTPEDYDKKYGRPDLKAAAPLIGEIIHTWLGDGATALVPSKLSDSDVNSPTYNTVTVDNPTGLIVLTQNQYARAVAECLTMITKIMRFFAVGTVVYDAESYDFGQPNIGPILDDTVRAT